VSSSLPPVTPKEIALSNVSQSYIATQNTVPRASIPTAMAILILCQNLGAAVFLTLAQTVFSNSLHSAITKDAPGVSADAVLAGGARMIRTLVSAQQLPGVLRAYSKAVGSVMYFRDWVREVGVCVCVGVGVEGY